MSQLVQLADVTYSEQVWNHHGLHSSVLTVGERKLHIILHSSFYMAGWIMGIVGTQSEHCSQAKVIIVWRWTIAGMVTVITSLVMKEYHFPDYMSDLQGFIQAHQLTDFVLVGTFYGGYHCFHLQRLVFSKTKPMYSD